MIFKRKTVGLALGGGGARGIAHIGVLKVLEQEKIDIDIISGTSMGAIIAALYSAEPNAKKLEKIVREENLPKLIDYTISSKEIVKGKKVEAFLNRELKGIQFEELKIPLHITAFDLENSQEVIFSKGDVTKAVRASMAIPGIFSPVENEGKILVDGGVRDPIPTEILEQKKADVIIASNVNYIKKKQPLTDQTAVKENKKIKIPNILKVSAKALQIIGSEISNADVEDDAIDLLINIELPNISLLNFKDPEKLIEIGEKTARKQIKEIRKLTKNPISRFFSEFRKKLYLKEIEKGFGIDKKTHVPNFLKNN